MKRGVKMFLALVLGISSLMLLGEIDARVSGHVATHATTHSGASHAGAGTTTVVNVR